MDSSKLFCLFCGCSIPNHDGTFREDEHYFLIRRPHFPIEENLSDKITIQTMNCPNCHKVSIDIVGVGSQFPNRIVHFNPISLAKVYPEYIPQTIRSDYEEAHAILNLSPKASATLSRRCLQGMIRDFWGISKARLVDEIDALIDLVDSNTSEVLNAIRKIANIGAHPERNINIIVDIEPNEAHKLLMFIESLMQKWYIERHEHEKLLQDILEIDEDKQNQRKPKKS